MARNLKRHEMSNDTKSQMTQNLNLQKSQMARNLKWHEISNDTKSQMTQNLK